MTSICKKGRRGGGMVNGGESEMKGKGIMLYLCRFSIKAIVVPKRDS
jgi:hypothetical protein